MKADRVFVGDIKKCTKYIMEPIFSTGVYIGDDCIGGDCFGHTIVESELHKENAILIEFNGGYVDVDNLKTVVDYIKVHKDITRDGFYMGGLIMSTMAHNSDSLFVDSESLKPYKTQNNKDNISIRQLRKERNHK